MRVFRLGSILLLLTLVAPPSTLADAALDSAIKLCDSQAGAPLINEPGVASIYLADLEANLLKPERQLDQATYLPLLAACSAAASAPNASPRFRYQQARLQGFSGMLNFKDKLMLQLALPIVEEYAAKGWPDAQYMASEFSFLSGDATGQKREKYRTWLLSAADAGHVMALQRASNALLFEGRSRTKKDVRRAARYLETLSKGAAPPPLKPGQGWLAESRFNAKLFLARVMVNDADFTPQEKQQAIAIFKAYSDAGDRGGKLSYAASLEKGRDIAKDPKAAFALYQQVIDTAPKEGPDYASNAARTSMAGLLLSDTLGKPDPARARNLLEAPLAQGKRLSDDAVNLLVPLLVDGKYFPREPRKAFDLLQDAQYSTESNIALAYLIWQTDYSPKNGKQLIEVLTRAATKNNNLEAALAFGRLAIANKHPFASAPERFTVLQPFAAANPEARLLLARLTFTNLGSTSFKTYVAAESPMSQDEALAALADGEKQRLASALVMKALMLRQGFVVPQDDRSATKLLIQAAQTDHVEAKLLAAEAYRSGLGVKKDVPKAVALWRDAAQSGNHQAREALASYFPFTADIGLAEYVATVMSLAANGEGFRYGASVIPSKLQLAGVFVNGRMLQEDPRNVATALLQAFRYVPAALSDENILLFAKAQTDDVRVALENALKQKGYYKGDAEGYIDPDLRDALRAYVKAEGPVLTLAAGE